MLATNFAELIPVERLLSRCPIFCPVATSFQLCWRKARGDKLLEWEIGIGKLTRPDVSHQPTSSNAKTSAFCVGRNASNLRGARRTILLGSSENVAKNVREDISPKSSAAVAHRHRRVGVIVFAKHYEK